jgi:hypothetical protein
MNNERQMKNRILILILPLLLLSSAGAFADSDDININTQGSGTGSGFRWGSYFIWENGDNTLIIEQSGTYTITGNGGETTNRIAVAYGVKAANITIENVKINVSDIVGAGAFYLDSGAEVTLTLLGENVLASGMGEAGLRVRSSCILTITEASTGKLTATGYGGAGIGSGLVNGATSGAITINGGTVTATSTGSGAENAGAGAGIGGSSMGRDVNVTINGGTVTATGYTGIGNGNTSFVSRVSVTINGGTVNANIQSQPRNSEHQIVYLNTLTVGSDANGDKSITAGSIKGENYENGISGINGMKTDDEGKVYVYLPASDGAEFVALTVDGVSYRKSYERKVDVSYEETLEPDATLKNLLVDGEEIPGFDPDKTNYQLTVPCGTEQITISGETNDAAASLAPAGVKTYQLEPGNNSFTLTVTAADKMTTKVYTVTVIRDCLAPGILKDLEDAIVCAGESHTFAVEAEGDNLSYEWYYGNERIKGANGNTYTITNAELRDYEHYYVIVRSQIGDYRSSVYSKNVRLWIAGQLPENLRFVDFPSTVTTGNTYRIKLAGYPDVTQYVWSYDRDGVTFSPETGGIGDNETLATFGVLSAGQGMLTVTLEHPCGTRQATQPILVQWPTGVEQIAGQAVRVFPNPTSGIIKVSGTRSNQIIRIVDITGSLKGNYPAQDSETTIDLTGYSKGTYLIQHNDKTVKAIRK